MSDFTVKQLEHFVHAVTTGSLSGAAKICHVSHAGISCSLKNLEASLGTQLLVRRKAKGVIPTLAGKALLPKAQEILAKVASIEVFGHHHDELLYGELVVGCTLALAPSHVPRIAGGFLAQHPQLEIQFCERPGAVLLHDVSEGQLDVALLFERQIPAEVPRTRLGTMPILAALPANHNLADRASIKLCELAEEPMIAPEGPALASMLTVLRTAGVEPWIRWKFTSPETIRSMVAKGFGYTLLTAGAPTGNPDYSGTAIVAIEDEHAINTVAIVISPRPSHAQAVDALSKYLMHESPLGSVPN